MGAAFENAEANAFNGKTLAGKYRVDRVIGVGGMGFVLGATHLHMDEPVAVKLLYTSFASKPDVVQRFMREAKAARKIRSEHVVRIHDVDVLETGAPYIVMEQLHGQDLEQIMRRMGRQPVATALDVILQASEALAEAHVQKMVHRDLKPANLFVTKRADGDALVKVLDFGISKVTGTGGSDLNITKAGDAILGSPQYMAPEQLKSLKDVDGRTDIWALGSILYEMLAGNPPFNATSLPELCVAILDHPPASLRAIRPDVPPGLEATIFACLAKEREGRPQTVAALASALAPFGPASVQASAGRINGIFRTARFARAGAGGSTMALAAVGPISSPNPQVEAGTAPSAPNPQAQTTPRSDTAPVRISNAPPAEGGMSPAPRSGPPPAMPTTGPQPIAVASTGNAFAKDRASARPPPPASQAGIAAAVLFVAAIAIGLLVVFVGLPFARSRQKSSAGNAPSATNSVAASSPPPPPVVSREIITPEPPASGSAVAAVASSAPDAAAAANASASAEAPKPMPKVDCTQKYTLDPDGVTKRWKRECF